MRNIRFGELRINSISRSSGVFAGDNRQAGFKSFSKSNQAFGSVSGEGSLVYDGRVRAKDADRIDMAWDGKTKER
ncbi:hypothetical protein [Cohnella sp. REN36]|uniref:hypothetical protein n=1 Tax=Cohnella sp. REN36 TaxID=2887347 RepID=UPI001D156EB8|nr:hypothetical protein [Cohnella sp. REN36]MCC3373113.1 hypothetical protein [Cohnella sp. REN36]